MNRIEIDVAALTERLQNDPVLRELELSREQWLQRQKEKRESYQSKINQTRQTIREKQKQIAQIKREIRKLEGQIGSFESFARFRSAGLRRIEKRIRDRKSYLKMAEIRKATAQAQEEVKDILRTHP